MSKASGYCPQCVAKDREILLLKRWGDLLLSDYKLRRRNETLVAEKEALEKKLAAQQAALHKLATLGNGESYGNSIGNCIAIDAMIGNSEELTKLLAAERKEGFEEGKQAGRDELSATKDKMAMMVDALSELGDYFGKQGYAMPNSNCARALIATSSEVAKHRAECDAKALEGIAVGLYGTADDCYKYVLRTANELRASSNPTTTIKEQP